MNIIEPELLEYALLYEPVLYHKYLRAYSRYTNMKVTLNGLRKHIAASKRQMQEEHELALTQMNRDLNSDGE